MRFTITLIALLLITMGSTAAAAELKVHEADVIVYGGTSAAIAAAVQVKRMGKSVIVVGPDKHLGGLSAGGLGWTDSGNKEVVGGISREFYQRIRKLYDQPASVTISNKNTDGYVIIDCIQWLPRPRKQFYNSGSSGESVGKFRAYW